MEIHDGGKPDMEGVFMKKILGLLLIVTALVLIGCPTGGDGYDADAKATLAARDKMIGTWFGFDNTTVEMGTELTFAKGDYYDIAGGSYTLLVGDYAIDPATGTGLSGVLLTTTYSSSGTFIIDPSTGDITFKDGHLDGETLGITYTGGSPATILVSGSTYITTTDPLEKQ